MIQSVLVWMTVSPSLQGQEIAASIQQWHSEFPSSCSLAQLPHHQDILSLACIVKKKKKKRSSVSFFNITHDYLPRFSACLGQNDVFCFCVCSVWSAVQCKTCNKWLKNTCTPRAVSQNSVTAAFQLSSVVWNLSWSLVSISSSAVTLHLCFLFYCYSTLHVRVQHHFQQVSLLLIAQVG